MRKLSHNHCINKFVFPLFIFWEAVLIILSQLPPKILNLDHGLPLALYDMNSDRSLFANRANFDGVHYLRISGNGYGLYQQAFFPLYPRLIKSLKPVFAGKDLLTAVFISNLSLLLLLYFFYKLVLVDFDDKVAKRSVLFLLIFPTSFFFGCVYAESLFLMLVLASFYAARREKWLIAGIVGFFASSTKIFGVLLFPALLWEWWEQNKAQGVKGKARSLLPILIIPLGLLSYMRFLWQKFGDPLMFIHVQSFFGAERSGGKIILIYQVFWRYLKMILTTKWDILYFTVWLELLVAVGFLTLIIICLKKRIRPSYLVFAFLAYLVPTLSGTFSSLPRYVLVLFPCFILMATIKSGKIRGLLYSIFAMLFIISCLLFFNGYWVS